MFRSMREPVHVYEKHLAFSNHMGVSNFKNTVKTKAWKWLNNTRKHPNFVTQNLCN